MSKLMVLFLLIFPFIAYGKKYALVVGGATNANVGAAQLTPTEVNPHEFGKSTARITYGLQRQGYEVTTLFDNIGTPSDQMPAGLKLLKDKSVDMPKLREMGAQSASKENILAALRNIRDNANPGDEFEFNLNAHGFRNCPGDADGRNGVSTNIKDRQNSKEGCQHSINLSDPVTGRTVQVPTSEISAILREIDSKGIKTNLNLVSCHSGAAQELFSGFRNTCVTYGSSANNYAFQCMPSDKSWDVSYTSTVESVATSLWAPYADEMLRDPYFQADACLPRLRDHARNIRGSNRYELFMSARRNDLNGEEPSISSQQGIAYFQSGLFTSIGSVYAGKIQDPLCAPSIDQRIVELQAIADAATETALEAVISPKRERLAQAIARYNDLLERQAAAGASQQGGNGAVIKAQEFDPDQPLQELPLGDESGEDLFAGLEKPEDGALTVQSGELSSGSATVSQPVPEAPAQSSELPQVDLPQLQRDTYEASKEVMAIEREIIDDIDRSLIRPQIPVSDPCRRS